MTQYYEVKPEVAGGWGENIDVTRIPGQPVRVNKLHYDFQGWDGDCLLTSAPVYIGTETLAKAVRTSGLTGVDFDKVEVTTSYPFDELYPGLKLPEFLWFKINGIPEQDDFGKVPGRRLVVSQKALDLLKDHGLNNADIEAVATKL